VFILFLNSITYFMLDIFCSKTDIYFFLYCWDGWEYTVAFTQVITMLQIHELTSDISFWFPVLYTTKHFCSTIPREWERQEAFGTHWTPTKC
jgi:hypothetical protein